MVGRFEDLFIFVAIFIYSLSAITLNFLAEVETVVAVTTKPVKVFILLEALAVSVGGTVSINNAAFKLIKYSPISSKKSS